MSDASHSSGEARGQIVDFRGGSASGTGLPPQLTSFVGREREIPMVKGLMRDTRLLTLTGAGGSGKTRLARAVVSEVEGGFEDGVWWVDLAPLSDPDLVSHGVASVLAVYATPGRTLAQAIAEDLRELEILLVLDNCEHLVGACAELADELLRSCPGLRILATSREPLGLAIERSLVGQPLSVPWSGDEGVDELQRFESVRLFVERARYGGVYPASRWMPTTHARSRRYVAGSTACRLPSSSRRPGFACYPWSKSLLAWRTISGS
jgi:hypothetical protein